jgi:hypothetical protein
MPETQGYKIVSISEDDWSLTKLCVWKRASYCYEQMDTTKDHPDPAVPAYWKEHGEKYDALIKRLEDL